MYGGSLASVRPRNVVDEYKTTTYTLNAPRVRSTTHAHTVAVSSTLHLPFPFRGTDNVFSKPDMQLAKFVLAASALFASAAASPVRQAEENPVTVSTNTITTLKGRYPDTVLTYCSGYWRFYRLHAGRYSACQCCGRVP